MKRGNINNMKAIKNISFVHFLAFYIVTWVMANYTFAILLPEQFSNSPVVTQFTTMGSNLLSFICGYYFGGINNKKKDQQDLAEK